MTNVVKSDIGIDETVTTDVNVENIGACSSIHCAHTMVSKLTPSILMPGRKREKVWKPSRLTYLQIYSARVRLLSKLEYPIPVMFGTAYEYRKATVCLSVYPYLM